MAALHVAAEAGRLGIVTLLLEARAKTELPGNCGRTALDFAADHSRSDVVNLLLEARANTELSNIRGQAALHVAAQRNHADIDCTPARGSWCRL